MGDASWRQEFDLSGGIDRRLSSVSRPPNKLLDVKNLLPRSPLGAKIIKKEETLLATGATGATAAIPATRSDGTLALVARNATTYLDLAGGALPVITYKTGAAQSKMAPYRGNIAIAQQGERVQILDIDNSTCTSETESPRAGLVAEYRSMLWAAADLLEDDSAPTVTIPLVGVVVPPEQVTSLVDGTGTVVYTEATGTSTVQDESGATGVFTGRKGKIIELAGSGYLITGVSTTSFADDTVTVDAVTGEPSDATGVPYRVLDGDPLIALPDEIDLGTQYLFARSGKSDVRVFNRGGISIRVTAVRPKGPEVMAEDLPSLPITIPPGGSLSFGVVFTPETKGTCEASIVIEHDYYGQGSITIPITCEGTTREVLASPTVIHFGAWLAETTSPAMAVEIQNPLSDAVTLKSSGWVFDGDSGNFTLDTPASLPGTDITIEPGEHYTLKFKFTPQAGATGAHTGSLTFKRTIPAKPYRIWRSRPGDPSNWTRDREWVDTSADGLAGGYIRAMEAYDDSLVIFRDASIWLVVPGGSGYKPVQLAVGEGVGAFGPEAVCVGGGSLWFASKQGVYHLAGRSMHKISDPIKDVMDALAPADYSSVWLTWYDGMLIMSLPTTSTFTAAVWVYKPGVPDAGGSWWRLDYAATTLATDNSATRKDALYAVIGDTVKHLDSLEGQSGVAWSLKTHVLGADTAIVLKALTELEVELSETTALTRASAVFSNGSLTHASLKALKDGSYMVGIGTYTAATHTLAIDQDTYDDHELDGLDITINGVTVAITSNIGTTITLAAAITGLTDMVVQYSIEKAPTTDIVKKRGIWGPWAVGSQFTIELTGSSVASGKGEIAGFLIGAENICEEAIS